MAEMVRRGARTAAAATEMSTTILKVAFPALALPLVSLGAIAEKERVDAYMRPHVYEETQRKKTKWKRRGQIRFGPPTLILIRG